MLAAVGTGLAEVGSQELNPDILEGVRSAGPSQLLLKVGAGRKLESGAEQAPGV